MWRPILPFMLTFGLTVPAIAIGRFDIHTRSCANVQSLLAKKGEAILRFPSKEKRMTLYDRYVSTSAQCGPGKYGIPASVPTATGACAVVKCTLLNNLSP